MNTSSADDVVIYIENPKESTERPPELAVSGTSQGISSIHRNSRVSIY